MDIYDKSLEAHRKWRGKIEIKSKAAVNNADALALAYTPGVARPCLEIQKNPEAVYALTQKHNLVAVISDGSAVLGLGNIGPLAALPVMEGKAVLFKEFGGVDAVPIILSTQDAAEIVETVIRIAPSFGGINLEDISAPRCFEIENRLKEALDIPVFHDDQHGTAVVVLAGIINSLKITGKKLKDIKIAINGAGAAGCSVSRLLLEYGAGNIILCDSKGIINKRNASAGYKKEMAEITNPDGGAGLLRDAVRGADIFVGLSVGGALTPEMVETMAKDAVVFALANPQPEILPVDAIRAGARIAATGRSDFPNQINNVLAFPGIFRGALDAGAVKITDGMKIAAAEAIAGLVKERELNEKYIIPGAFDKRVGKAVSAAVQAQAVKEKIIRGGFNPE